MNENELLNKLKGIQTIKSIMDILNVGREKAIYYVFRLRRKGYVKTKRLSDNKRVYHISFENRLKGTSYYDIINAYSPIKITTTTTYYIYGKKPDLEEAIIYALKTKSLRTILASLSLFKRLTNWNKLYRLAKKENLERQIGALYDMSKTIMRVKRMTKRFRNNSLPKKNSSFAYILSGLKSDDFKNIEKLWRIYIPFNKKDLEVYKK